jgi:hypothetical protein
VERRSAEAFREDEAADEVLGARAKRAYELRAEQLSEMLADTRSAGDGEGAATVKEELGFVTTELARGVGIGGRRRTPSAPASAPPARCAPPSTRSVPSTPRWAVISR